MDYQALALVSAAGALNPLDPDPRVVCIECRHHRAGRCSNHRVAGLRQNYLGEDLANLRQWCLGYAPINERP